VVEILSGAGLAHAQARAERELEIELDAPATCATSEQIYERVESLTGSLEGSRHLRAEIGFQVLPNAVQVKLRTEEGGEAFARDLETPGCEEAVQTTALILALALRPELRAATASPRTAGEEALASAPAPLPPAGATQAEPAQPPAGATEPALPPTEPAQPAEGTGFATERAPEKTQAKVASPSTWRGVASVGGFGGVGMLPTLVYGFGASGGVRRGGFSGEVYGFFQPALRVAVQDGTTGGDFSLWAFGVRGCLMRPLGKPASHFEAGVCALGEGGQLNANGFGTVTTHSVQTAWGALGAGVGLGMQLGGPWLLRLDTSVLVPLMRDVFQIDDGGQTVRVAQVGEVTGRLELRVGLSF